MEKGTLQFTAIEKEFALQKLGCFCHVNTYSDR
jgi:hypothetical protein